MVVSNEISREGNNRVVNGELNERLKERVLTLRTSEKLKSVIEKLKPDQDRMRSLLRYFAISTLNDQERITYYTIKTNEKHRLLNKSVVTGSLLAGGSILLFLSSPQGEAFIESFKTQYNHLSPILIFGFLGYNLACTFISYLLLSKTSPLEEEEMEEYFSESLLLKSRRLFYINSRPKTILELMKKLELKDEHFEDFRDLIDHSYENLAITLKESDIFLAERLLKKSLNDISVLEQLLMLYLTTY
jgi:hypothetical protein